MTNQKDLIGKAEVSILVERAHSKVLKAGIGTKSIISYNLRVFQIVFILTQAVLVLRQEPSNYQFQKAKLLTI